FSSSVMSSEIICVAFIVRPPYTPCACFLSYLFVCIYVALTFTYYTPYIACWLPFLAVKIPTIACGFLFVECSNRQPIGRRRLQAARHFVAADVGSHPPVN